MTEVGLVLGSVICGCGCIFCLTLMDENPCLPCEACEACLYSPQFRQTICEDYCSCFSCFYPEDWKQIH